MTIKQVGSIHIVLLAGLYILAFNTNGTGGGGDSLTHFFIAQLSWEDPSFFFHNWGKPFFTLFASPWAQFGLVGIKLFNITCGVLASFVTYLVALKLNKPWAWAIPFIAFIGPAYYTYLFTGLTEPFSALVTITAVYLCLDKKVSAGLILASFLPFCRNEAQIFLPFFAIFALLNGNWKKIPLLLVGYVAYSLIGGLYLEDMAWAFKSPYNSNGSAYGSGNWDHYISRIEGMYGILSVITLVLGIGYGVVKWIKGKMDWRREPWLIQALFLSLFVVHSAVWALGIYGSAGLERTIILVFPFMWLIILDGAFGLKELLSRFYPKLAWIFPILLMIAHTINVFTKPLTKHYYINHVLLSADNEFIRDIVGQDIDREHPSVRHFVIDKPYMAVALGLNFMNDRERSNWSFYRKLDDLPKGALLIYDSYYVPIQYGINLEQIEADGKLQELMKWDDPNSDFHYILFKPKN